MTQQVQALVYQLNRQLQGVFIKANLVFVQLLLHGGKGSFLGSEFTVLGLDGTERLLAGMPPGKRVAGDPRLRPRRAQSGSRRPAPR